MISLLPTKEDISSYIDSFQLRAQANSFPFVPEQVTQSEVHRFLADPERNAQIYPDQLALIFATLAQGIQHGAYDRCGKQWIAGVVENEIKKGDVFGIVYTHSY